MHGGKKTRSDFIMLNTKEKWWMRYKKIAVSPETKAESEVNGMAILEVEERVKREWSVGR